MMRMLKMELAVFGQYLKQLTLSILFMAVCFTAGMGSASMLPGIIFMMGMFCLSNSASHYDEQNDWAAFRLTMPVSRRDVVLGRYLFVLAGALIASLFVASRGGRQRGAPRCGYDSGGGVRPCVLQCHGVCDCIGIHAGVLQIRSDQGDAVVALHHDVLGSCSVNGGRPYGRGGHFGHATGAFIRGNA